MEDILFIGPIATTGGPAIKNRILLDHLQKKTSIKAWNTYNKSVKARVGAIAHILFAKQKYIIIAVSRKGRNLLYPFLRIKAKISGCQYCCIVIGGKAVESFTNKSSIKALHAADIVTVETEGLKLQLENAFNLNNVYLMPNYKELDQSIKTVTEDSFQTLPMRMIFLSSMRNLKGIKTLITAFKKCRENGLKIELDFYGPIKDDFDKSLLNVIEQTEGLRYCGEVKNNEVLDIMSGYNIFVFPTEHPHEGFPAVLVEGMSVGLPVIASNINYNGEIVKDSINGFIFPYGDASRLAEIIQYGFEHREELIEISKRNILSAKQYNAATVIDAFADELKKVGWPV